MCIDVFDCSVLEFVVHFVCWVTLLCKWLRLISWLMYFSLTLLLKSSTVMVGYRGVICGMDPVCCESSAWIEKANVQSLSRGSNQPFYQVKAWSPIQSLLQNSNTYSLLWFLSSFSPSQGGNYRAMLLVLALTMIMHSSLSYTLSGYLIISFFTFLTHSCPRRLWPIGWASSFVSKVLNLLHFRSW